MLFHITYGCARWIWLDRITIFSLNAAIAHQAVPAILLPANTNALPTLCGRVIPIFAINFKDFSGDFMTEVQRRSRVDQTRCPECKEQINGLADGLCPGCGFPMQELIQYVEQTEATHRSDSLQRERSGRIEGVIAHRDDIFGGQVVVLTNPRQLAVGFIQHEPELAVGQRGALQFTASPSALFFAREPDTAEVVTPNGLRAFSSEVKLPKRTNELPPSIVFLGMLGYLNLLIAGSAGFIGLVIDYQSMGIALIIQAVFGTTLLRVIYHIAESVWQMREVALRLPKMKIHSVEEPSSDVTVTPNAAGD
ncbi:hypothetical protein [Bradymonas sediminis]|uniref:hypothetical protein n=1 Tax=Bradymonas sediminis TaxID=1548548 RepID=UPI00105BF55E|nr:hypothetical protein [Bradymonas sediminis]